MASGSLSLNRRSNDYIIVDYSFSVALFVKLNGNSVGSGNGSGSMTFDGLSPSTSYTFTLASAGATLAQISISTTSSGGTTPPPSGGGTTPPPPPPPPPLQTFSGTLSAAVVSSTAVDLNYTYTQGADVYLDRDGTQVIIFCIGESGGGAGVYHDTGLAPNTTYCYSLMAHSVIAAQATVATPPTPTPPPPPPPTVEGYLSGVVIDYTTIDLTYSYVNGTNVSLFSGASLVITFGSGSSSGIYRNSNLTPNTVYTYYLRNGATPESALLGEVTLLTPVVPPEGTLSSQIVDSNTIDLTYSFVYGTNVSLFRGTTKVTTFGSGAGSGTYRNGDLTANTSYTYTLRNGATITDTLLATSTAKTLKGARQYVIARGKILPLSSLITIFDSTLTRLGILEDYEYLNWTFRFRKVDSFTLTINRYKANTIYLVKGNILALYVAGYYRAAVIESIGIELTEEGKISENYTINGRGLGGLLAERIALHVTDSGTGYDSQNTLASTAMRHYVNVNAMDAADTDRNYPLLFLESPDPAAGGNVKYDARFQYISELLEEISLASSIGWEIVLDPTSKKLVFKNIIGLDRSFGNGVNSVVTFSPKFGNIKLISYIDSNINSKNVAYVAGQDLANLRDVDKVTYLAVTYTGMARREFLIDARDQDTTDKMLQRGNERLVELGETKVIETENLAAGPFSFGEDFYLGDIVTVDYPDIVSADVRVIESVIEISPQNLIQNKLIFGKQFPDLISINNSNNKNILTEVRR